MPLNDPVPSTAADVLERNVQDFDRFVVGAENTFVNRLGVEKPTVAGIISTANEAIATIEADGAAAIAEKTAEASAAINKIESDGAAAINALRVVNAGSFEDGATLTARNEVLYYLAEQTYYRWDGALPKTVPPASTPASTGGVGAGAWVDVGDAALRSDFQQGKLRSTNYTTDRVARRGGLNSHSLHLTTEKVRPVVSFIDDDGLKQFLTKLKPIFDSKGIKTALAIFTNGPDNLSYVMSWQEIIDLYNQGYEIMSHTHTNLNLTGVSAETAEYEFSQSRYELESRGIDVESFVYVQGARGSADVRNLVRKYFRSAYVTQSGGIQPRPLQDWYVRRKNAVEQTVEANPTLQELKDLVDYAEANNEWVVFTTHAGYAGMDSAQQQVISDLIDYIQGKGIEILTPSKALDIHGSKFFAGNTNDESFQLNLDSANGFTKVDKNGDVWPKNIEMSVEGGKSQATPITDYPVNQMTVFRTDFGSSWPLGAIGIVETMRIAQVGDFGWQRFTPENSNRILFRAWNRGTGNWEEWRQYQDNQYLGTISDGSKPITEYPLNSLSVELVASSASNFPESGSNSRGLLSTFRSAFTPDPQNVGYQTYTPNGRDYYYVRTWNFFTNEWREWIREQELRSVPVDRSNTSPLTLENLCSITGYTTADATTYSMPENAAGTRVRYRSGPSAYMSYETYHVFRSGRMYHRYYDDVGSAWSDWKLIAGGATGTFESQDGKTVTVTNGIITAIT